jgi:hypothetical protein
MRTVGSYQQSYRSSRVAARYAQRCPVARTGQNNRQSSRLSSARPAATTGSTRFAMMNGRYTGRPGGKEPLDAHIHLREAGHGSME